MDYIKWWSKFCWSVKVYFQSKVKWSISKCINHSFFIERECIEFIVLLFWNTIWFYHVLVRESSMSSWGAGFDQSFKMPTSFRIVSFSWGTKTICFWKPSAISSLRKKSWKRKKPPAAGLQPFGPLSARGAPAWQESSARSGPEPEYTGLVWSCFSSSSTRNWYERGLVPTW